MLSQLTVIAPIILYAAISYAQPVSFVARAEAAADNKFRNTVIIFACALGGGLALNILLFIAVHCWCTKKQSVEDHVDETDGSNTHTATPGNIYPPNRSNRPAASENNVPMTNGSNIPTATGTTDNLYSSNRSNRSTAGVDGTSIANSTDSSTAHRGFTDRQRLPPRTPTHINKGNDIVFKTRQEVEALAAYAIDLENTTREIEKDILNFVKDYSAGKCIPTPSQLFQYAEWNIDVLKGCFGESIRLCHRCLECRNIAFRQLGEEEILIESNIAICEKANEFIEKKLAIAKAAFKKLEQAV